MSSAREEAQVQEILKELRKQADNKTCMICTEKFPQYICTNFGTFVCSSCSGIHREFGHRIKGISLSTFTLSEVREFQKQGNGAAISAYLARWNPSDYPKPDPSNKEEVRRFIRMAFVDQAWRAKAGASAEPQRQAQPVQEKPKKTKDYMVAIPPRGAAAPAAPSPAGPPKASIDDLLISWDDNPQSQSQPQAQPQHQMFPPVASKPEPQPSSNGSPFTAFYDPQPQQQPMQPQPQAQSPQRPAVAAAPLSLPSTISIPQASQMPQYQQPQMQQQPQYMGQPQQQFMPFPQPAGAQPQILFNPFGGQPQFQPQMQPQQQQPQVQQIQLQMSPQPQPQYRPQQQQQPQAPQGAMMFNPFGPQPVLTGMPQGNGAPMMVMQMPPQGAMMMAAPPQQGRPGGPMMAPQPIFVPTGAPMPGGQPQMMMRPVGMAPQVQPMLGGQPAGAVDADYLLALRLQEEENRAAGSGPRGVSNPAAFMSEDEKLARRLQEEENARAAFQ